MLIHLFLMPVPANVLKRREYGFNLEKQTVFPINTQRAISIKLCPRLISNHMIGNIFASKFFEVLWHIHIWLKALTHVLSSCLYRRVKEKHPPKFGGGSTPALNPCRLTSCRSSILFMFPGSTRARKVLTDLFPRSHLSKLPLHHLEGKGRALWDVIHRDLGMV